MAYWKGDQSSIPKVPNTENNILNNIVIKSSSSKKQWRINPYTGRCIFVAASTYYPQGRLPFERTEAADDPLNGYAEFGSVILSLGILLPIGGP